MRAKYQKVTHLAGRGHKSSRSISEHDRLCRTRQIAYRWLRLTAEIDAGNSCTCVGYDSREGELTSVEERSSQDTCEPVVLDDAVCVWEDMTAGPSGGLGVCVDMTAM